VRYPGQGAAGISINPTMSTAAVDTSADLDAGTVEPGTDQRSGWWRAAGGPTLAVAVYLILAVGLFWPVWSTHPTTVS
jgi:hypothetical protein